MIGQTISHYKILEKLGEGGMGVVYKAQDLKLDRIVAIKLLSPHLSASADSKARFLQEAKATAALNHPNILNVYEIDEQDSGMFFAMEYIEGMTLKKHIANLKSGKGIPVIQALEWTAEIAQGLKAAHDKNIVHRDIKPENIMLTPEGKLKIMDFGIAKLKSSSGLTKTGTSMGTISYMSPEQAQGDAADQRSDIWSLGIVFFEMLTVDLPFKAEHEAGLLYLIVNQDPPVPSDFDRTIPRPVDEAFRKMITKDPAHRYQSADEVIRAMNTLGSELKHGSVVSEKKAIAVLPFANIGDDKDNEYFGDGLTEELIVNLSQLKDIEVISRSSSMQFKGSNKDIKAIGRELKARYILEGSVRKFQDNLRIAVQLIDVENGRQLWAGSYKGTLADVFDIQEQVSKQIVEALMVKLTPTEKVVLGKRSTVNAEAFDCYLRARDFLYRRSKNSVNFSIELFQRAIELDPRYACAYAGLGEAYATYYQTFERKESWLEKAIDSSLKALMYDPSLSEAYAALALSYFNKKQYSEALEAGKKATELDPNNYVAYWILGRIYRTSDREQESLDLFLRTLTINPDFYSAFGDLEMVYERLGDVEKFKEISEQALKFYPRYLSKHPDDSRAHMYYALALARVKKIEESKHVAAKALNLSPDDTVMMYNASCFYSKIGEIQLAVQTLKKAVSAGYENFEWIKRDPDFDNIRNESDYIELMKGK